MITMFPSQFRVQKLGWALLHFLWQGTMIAVVYAALRRLLNPHLLVANEKVMDFSEDGGSIANASDNQVTIEKMLPLNSFAPGNYAIRVKATDKIRNEIPRQQGTFTVSPE